MPCYVALLRAVNVGGTGKLRMSDLKAMCEDAGFDRVETYIASGNVVFESDVSPLVVKEALETRLRDHAGKPVNVFVRTAAEMQEILAKNPFTEAAAKFTAVFFLDDAPTEGDLDSAGGLNDEEMRLGVREIYVHYPSGMGRSKLKIPAADAGTARNMNTVAKLAALASKR